MAHVGFIQFFQCYHVPIYHVLYVRLTNYIPMMVIPPPSNLIKLHFRIYDRTWYFYVNKSKKKRKWRLVILNSIKVYTYIILYYYTRLEKSDRAICSNLLYAFYNKSRRRRQQARDGISRAVGDDIFSRPAYHDRCVGNYAVSIK